MNTGLHVRRKLILAAMVISGIPLAASVMTKDDRSVQSTLLQKKQIVAPPQETTTLPPEEILYVHSLDYDAEDAYLLAKIAMAEAEGEDTEGKALVILVVLNRVWSDEFPDSIEAVIFQDGQFSPVKPGGRWYTTEPDEDCYAALRLVESGWDESQGALYFERTSEKSTWHSRNLQELFTHGNHTFYK